MVGVRVASQEVWAALVLAVAPNNTEIIHQAGTQAGALHGDEVILTYRYDDTFVSGYIGAHSHISKKFNQDKIIASTSVISIVRC